MARKQNVTTLADASTFSIMGSFRLVLTAGSANATLTLTVGGVEIMALAAVTGTTEHSPCLFGRDNETATVALSGTGAKAFAVWE